METPTPRVAPVVHRRQQPQQQERQPQPRTAPQRPVSLYDNLKQPNGGGHNGGGLNGHSTGGGLGAAGPDLQQPLVRGGASSVGNLNAVHHVSVALTERARTPSQANCLSTTVPQNMAAVGFASRHAPTRSSLRHSRMIVMTREGRGNARSFPLDAPRVPQTIVPLGRCPSRPPTRARRAACTQRPS